MTKRYNAKLCEWCGKHPAKVLALQPTKGLLVFDVCVYCWDRYNRYHYDTITVTDSDVVGIEDGKPIFRDGLFPDRQVLVRYKLERLRNVV